jgi:hypothetical protein
MWSMAEASGRLLNIRFSGTVSLEEADASIAAIRKFVVGAGGRVILCGDLRGLRVLAPQVAERFVGLFRNDNPSIQRSAMLLDDERTPGGATMALQLERMVREGGSPIRRTFRSAAPMLTWLGELLSDGEKAIAAAFLGN